MENNFISSFNNGGWFSHRAVSGGSEGSPYLFDSDGLDSITKHAGSFYYWLN